MLWISNLVAYSLQLAVLVVAAITIAALLRIDRPSAALRFWRGVFAMTFLWPAVQLWGYAVGEGAIMTSAVFQGVAERALLAPAGSPPQFALTVAEIGLVVLGAGIAFRLAGIIVGLRTLRMMRRQSAAASTLAPIAGALQKDLGTAAEICFTTTITSPATYGFVRPTVLLPRSVEALPPDVQRAVLCHELLHVARRDWLVTMVEEVWCAVLWFHPAARALAAQLQYVRETVVDQTTIAHTGNRRAYAAALLAFADAEPPAAATAAFIGRRFKDRIALISQEEDMSHTSLRFRFVIAACSVVVATLATTMVAPLSLTAAGQEQAVYKPSDGVTLPRVIKEVKPVYTPEAMRAKVHGTVWMQAVVLSTGNVGDVAVVKSLDREHGLDDQAVEALRQWVFEPGTKDGVPVAVEVTIEMTFTLK